MQHTTVRDGGSIMIIIKDRIQKKIKRLLDVQASLSGSKNTIIAGEIIGLQDALDIIDSTSIFDPESGAQTSVDEPKEGEKRAEFATIDGEQ